MYRQHIRMHKIRHRSYCFTHLLREDIDYRRTDSEAHGKNETHHLLCFFSARAQASFSATVRFNTGFPGFESGSTQK